MPLPDHAAPSRAPSPEARLVLACAGQAGGSALVRALLPRVRDWDRVVAIGNRLGAHPVLTRRLRECDAPLPDDVRATLAQLERGAELRAAYMRRRLDDALARLAAARVPVMLLKGAALARVAYASFAERPMADLDLLVAPGDTERAVRALAGGDWRQELDPSYAAYFDDMQHVAPLLDTRLPALAVRIELHTEAFGSGTSAFGLAAARFWSTAVALPGMPGVMVPSPELRLLHCCLHFAWSHEMIVGAWRAVADVDAIWREGAVDWERVPRLAREAGGATCVYWTLRLARELAGVPIPDALLARIGAPRPALLNRLLARHFALVASGDGTACPSTKLSRLLWSAAIRPAASGAGAVRPWSGNDKPWEAVKASAYGRGADAAPGPAAAPPARPDWRGYLGALARAR